MIMNSSRFDVLVSRVLRVGDAEGLGGDIVIEVGRPYWVEIGVEAACPVAFWGDVGRANDIRGIDLMDAVGQAIAFIDAYLRAEGKGKEFFWPNGERF
jgi:hypothetical protein